MKTNKVNVDVLKLAKLANLGCSDSEAKLYSGQLQTIIVHVQKLSEVNTDGVLPTSQTTGLTDVLRNDEVVSSGMTVDDAMLNATKSQNGYYCVPVVIDKYDE